MGGNGAAPQDSEDFVTSVLGRLGRESRLRDGGLPLEGKLKERHKAKAASAVIRPVTSVHLALDLRSALSPRKHGPNARASPFADSQKESALTY